MLITEHFRIFKILRTLLKEIEAKGEKHIVLDCTVDTLVVFLKQAQQIGLITASYSFFITSLVDKLG